jgi:RNA polymerase nonessential primary-like sigma factor
MRTDTPSPISERLIELAQLYFSGALQFDYLSSGRGSRQTRPLRALTSSIAARNTPGARGQDTVRRYLNEIATRKRLSSVEEYRLARRACKGDTEARRLLIEHHLRLVVLLARPYRDRGLPLMDLIEEGNLGLLHAMEKFDPERGCRFSTYAKWWIRQSIELGLMTQAGTVRVPVHVRRALKRQSKAFVLGRRADSDPASAPTPALTEAGRDKPLHGAAKFLLHDMRNLHDTSNGESAPSLLDSVAAPEHEQPDWQVHVATRRKHLLAALKLLKDTEQLVLNARFGLVDDTDRTLQCIARELNLSLERVRQIQCEALGKLRNILRQTNTDRDAEELL